MFDCRTITPLEEIAFCLLKGKCGSRFQGGCTAANYLIRRLQEVLPQPYPCQLVIKETSCTKCLKRIISGQCKIYNDCRSPFFLGLKKVSEEGENAFKYREVTGDFTIMSDWLEGSRETIIKFSKKVLVPWEESPKQTSQQVAEAIIKNSLPPKSSPSKVSKLESPLLQVKGGYIHDPKGELVCEKCHRKVYTLYKREKMAICSRCVESGKQTPVEKEKSKFPLIVKADQLKTVFGKTHCQKLKDVGLTTVEDVLRAIKKEELGDRIGSKISENRIIKRLKKAGIEV